jgi:hypothetical protein
VDQGKLIIEHYLNQLLVMVLAAHLLPYLAELVEVFILKLLMLVLI